MCVNYQQPTTLAGNRGLRFKMFNDSKDHTNMIRDEWSEETGWSNTYFAGLDFINTYAEACFAPPDSQKYK